MNKILKRGFTLIELLVVIAIIGILISVGSVSYLRAVKLSRDSKRKTDLEQIRQALETYRSENGIYPPSEATAKSLLEPNYISVWPTDPKAYSYRYIPSGNTYNLCAYLEVAPSTLPSYCASISCYIGSCNYQVTNP